ncbi:Homeodomain-like protein [Cunninghamella echinulata]|nr:Homeodomain-like protein [Cunninghamella echinulata]
MSLRRSTRIQKKVDKNDQEHLHSNNENIQLKRKRSNKAISSSTKKGKGKEKEKDIVTTTDRTKCTITDIPKETLTDTKLDIPIKTTEMTVTTNDTNVDHISQKNEQVNEEKQTTMDILTSAIDLQNINNLPIGSYARDKKIIEEALRINEELQNLVESQIEKIDNRLEENEELTKIARLLSIREARSKRKRIDIHKPYEKGFDYFKDIHGVSVPNNEENQSNEICIERSRAWQIKEREMLSEAIRTEVQRVTAYGHLTRNEAWRVWEIDNIARREWENYPVDKLDWNRISSLYVKTRTPMECMIQWTTQDHPAINKTPWSKKESEKLAQLVREYGLEGQWERIAIELNSNRTASQCFSHYQAESNALNAKRPWTKEDDEILKEAVTLVGEKSWQQIASIVGGRSGQQCLHRWLKTINPAIRRSKWTEEEDNALRGAVEVYGVGNWASVQRYIPGRTDMQCRERWMNCLDPNIIRGEFTEEEKQKLKDLVERHGKRWSYLTQFFPGRTDNNLLRRWNSLQKPPGKKGRKKKTAES